MRLRAMLFAALVAAAPGVASGQAPGPPEGGQSLTTAPASRTIIAIPPTPPAEPAPQEPAIDPPPDFAELAGKPVTPFVVVFEGNVLDHVLASPPARRASSTSAISMCSVPSPSRSRRRRPRTGST